MSLLRYLKNVSQTSITLDDMNGVTLSAGESIDGNMFGSDRLKSSVSVAQAFLSGQLVLIDETTAQYSGMQALDVVRYGSASKDGKQLTISSDRPTNTVRHFTGASDDSALGIGKGGSFIYNVSPQSTQSVYCNFNTDIFLKDGQMLFENASVGTYLTVEVVAPPNTPFPYPPCTGNRDLVNGAFVVNSTNTGAYMSLPVEVTLFRFINKMGFLGTSSAPMTINVPECQIVQPIYKIKMSIFNNNAAESGVNVQACVTLGLYRTSTV